MKKGLIALIVLGILVIGNLFGATEVQQVTIANSTLDQTITFNYFSTSTGTLTGVTVELYTTTTGGYHHADNDGDTIADPVSISLGATFNLKDNLTAPRLLNNIAADIWDSETTDTHNTSLAVENGDGAVFDTSAPDGVQWFATGSDDIVTDNIMGAFIAGYEGSGTFTYTLSKTDYINIIATGGDVVGQYSGSDLGGYVKLTYTYDSPVPVTLSEFTISMAAGLPMINWTTQSETSSLGWHIYRNTEDNIEGAERINPSLIEGAGFSSTPIMYSYSDLDILEVGSTYWYYLENLDYDGSSETVASGSVTITEITEEEIPDHQDVFLGNNPNPFNPTTYIHFSLSIKSDVVMAIYNMKGQKVIELLNGTLEPGDYSKEWNGIDMDGNSISSGVYFTTLSINGRPYKKKMALIK